MIMLSIKEKMLLGLLSIRGKMFPFPEGIEIDKSNPQELGFFPHQSNVSTLTT